jgi:16S rRNA (uracil1498-N3)-methyltransferase
MNRFYVPKKNISFGQMMIVEPSDVHHLVHVLRLKTGDKVCVSDGEGVNYETRVASLLREKVILQIEGQSPLKAKNQKKAHISLGIAVPKNARFEEIVDKLTQLGIDVIIPLFTERTLVRKEFFDKRRDRLFRVMFSAAKQSGVSVLPELKEGVDFLTFLKSLSTYDVCLLPNLSQQDLSLKKAVSTLKTRSKTVRILVLIGPEGDFTKREIDLALKAGCQAVSLGESVLRVDTAALAVASFLKLFF